jgi:hypothetical protein
MTCTTAIRELRGLSTRPFPCPGEAGWPLGTMFPAANGKSEGGMYGPISVIWRECVVTISYR